MQLPTVFSSLLLLGGLAIAVPVSDVEEACEEHVICIDAINSCGIKYGGCYDVCKVSAKPVAPPCPVTVTATRISTKITQLPTRTPVPSSTKKASSTTKRSLTTSTRRATPTSTKKASSTTRKVTSTSTKKPTTPKPFTTSKTTVKPSSICNGSGMTVCWDGINECGQMYGACFPDCKPWPTPSAPPCKLTTRIIPTIPGGPIPVPTDYPILPVARE